MTNWRAKPYDGRCVCRGGDALPCREPGAFCSTTSAEWWERQLSLLGPAADENGHGPDSSRGAPAGRRGRPPGRRDPGASPPHS